MSHTPTDPIKSTAAQILALPYPEGMTGNQQRAFERGLEAAAAIVEEMPAQVTVKPLVWEDGYSSNPHKLTKARCNVIDQEHIIWVDCTDVEAEKRAFEQHRERLILSAIELTPTPVAANPAPDPVAKTPALDALAMQTVTVKSMRDWQDSLNAHGYPDTAVTAGIAADVIQRLPKPDRADVMAEAMKLPEVVALVEVARRYKESSCEGFCTDLPNADTSYPNMHLDCGGCELRVALAAMKGASHE